ncbi:MAG: KH domain-containing protein [Candidatus Altiarchaeota archaeon]|nr:KH domain-containing protein [Candidatus Altiarchaeota archaeon]
MNEPTQRQFVVPGEEIGTGIRCEGSVIKDNEKVISTVKGLMRRTNDSVSVIPLNGVYKPKEGDMVVGVVEHDFGGIYALDIHSPYRCILRPKREGNRGQGRDRRGGGNRYERAEPESYNLGDVVSAKISSVDEVYEAQLTGPRILEKGLIVSVKPARVPRIIGKKKSMIEVIRQYTGSRISVGQNGLIWIKEGDVALAREAIRMVEEQAYQSGLTDKMTNYLKEKKSNSLK